MSNGDWIDRVRSSRPEDYSSGDLGRLRDEARRSPEVRKALADEIRLDQALHASLGRAPLSTAKIVAAATAAAAAGGGFIGALAGWLGAMVATAAVGLVIVVALPEPGAGPDREAVAPGQGTVLQAPAETPKETDPRFVDDGSSPSDHLPLIVPPPDPSPPPQIAKSSPAEKTPVEKSLAVDKLPGVKTPPERDEATGPLRGVTQK
jgi:hypothetical protein